MTVIVISNSQGLLVAKKCWIKVSWYH